MPDHKNVSAQPDEAYGQADIPSIRPLTRLFTCRTRHPAGNGATIWLSTRSCRPSVRSVKLRLVSSREVTHPLILSRLMPTGQNHTFRNNF